MILGLLIFNIIHDFFMMFCITRADLLQNVSTQEINNIKINFLVRYNKSFINIKH